jgi:phage terminase large subunit-like protein
MWDLLVRLAFPVTKKSNVNDGELTLVNGIKIRIRGCDNPDALRGMKVHYVVIDEVKDIKPMVWEDIIRPSLSDLKGGALFIGTPDSGDSLFREYYDRGVEGDDPEWKSWHLTTYDNELIDPQEIENAKRSMSTMAFNREYMASFESMSEDIFKESWLKYGDTPPKQCDTYIAVDPAGFEEVKDATKKKHLDNTSIAVVKVDDLGKWWVQKIEYGRWDVRETATRILMAIRSHKPLMVGIEKGSLQRALQPYLMDLMRKNNVYAHIEAIPIGGGSKTNRITYNLQGLFEHGRITLNSREDWTQFKKEYVSFPSPKAHDDLIDSLSLVANLVNTSYAKPDDSEEYEVLDVTCGF